MSDVAINQVLAQMRVMAAQAGIETRPAEGAVQGTHFAELMQETIQDVNAAMVEAKAQATAFEMGDPQVSIAEVMVASQRAGLQFQAVTEVRNKLLTAYQEIMSMQV
jgi:flagellar hook-basal body complex protein FliE